MKIASSRFFAVIVGSLGAAGFVLSSRNLYSEIKVSVLNDVFSQGLVGASAGLIGSMFALFFAFNLFNGRFGNGK